MSGAGKHESGGTQRQTVSIHASPWYYELRTIRTLLEVTLHDVLLEHHHRLKIERCRSMIDILIRRIEDVPYSISEVTGTSYSSQAPEADLGEEL